MVRARLGTGLGQLGPLAADLALEEPRAGVEENVPAGAVLRPDPLSAARFDQGVERQYPESGVIVIHQAEEVTAGEIQQRQREDRGPDPAA